MTVQTAERSKLKRVDETGIRELMTILRRSGFFTPEDQDEITTDHF